MQTMARRNLFVPGRVDQELKAPLVENLLNVETRWHQSIVSKKNKEEEESSLVVTLGQTSCFVLMLGYANCFCTV